MIFNCLFVYIIYDKKVMVSAAFKIEIFGKHLIISNCHLLNQIYLLWKEYQVELNGIEDDYHIDTNLLKIIFLTYDLKGFFIRLSRYWKIVFITRFLNLNDNKYLLRQKKIDLLDDSTITIFM